MGQLAHAEVVDDEHGHAGQLGQVLAGVGERGFCELFEEGIRFAVDDAIALLDRGAAPFTTSASETTDRAARRQLTTALDEIRRQLKAVQSTLHVSEPKTASSRRTITLPSLVSDALRAHRTRQLEDRLAAGGRWIDSGMVFTSTVGALMEPRTMQRKFKAILRTAELPNIRYHDLRHTAATLLLAQGVDPRTIMETLGHSQISMTLNTYAHVVPALRRVAAEKMDAILKG